MSIKIKVSYTEPGELTRVLSLLSPMDLQVKIQKDELKTGYKRAYLLTKNAKYR